MKQTVVLGLILILVVGCVGLIDTVHLENERISPQDIEGTWVEADNKLFPEDPASITVHRKGDGMYRFTGSTPICTDFEAFLFAFDGRIYAECTRKNLEQKINLDLIGAVPLRYLLELQISGDGKKLTIRELNAQKITRIARNDETVGIVERSGWGPSVVITGHRSKLRGLLLKEDVLYKPSVYNRVNEKAILPRESR